LLDVNVHPTKREVRFRDQRLIYDLVKECVKTGLREASNPGLGLSDRVQEASLSYLRTHSGDPRVEWRPTGQGKETDLMSRTVKTDPVAASFAGQEQGQLVEFLAEILPLGQMYDTYILARLHGELWILDQHAAHERVLYERFLEDLQKTRMASQQLLLPQAFELSAAQTIILREVMGPLESLGFELELFGPQSVVIRTVPLFLSKTDLQGLIMDLIEDWITHEKTSSAQDRQKRLIATLACHGAVKANQTLTVPEMEALVKDVLQLPTSVTTCPHGRPLKKRFTRKELETMFHRS
jgi:DNA mismatch repair protein MutL